MNSYNRFYSDREITLQDRYESFSGGIPMLIPKLVDYIVFIGYEEFIKELEAGKSDPIKNNRDNFYYLALGISNIKKEEIESCMKSAALTLKSIESKVASKSECDAQLKVARVNWSIHVEKTKNILAMYGEWAYEIESEWFNSIFKSAYTNPFSPSRLKLTGFNYLLESPEVFAKHRDNFDGKVEAIDGVIANVFCNDKIPDHISATEFSEIINTIRAHYEQCKMIEEKCQVLNKDLDELRCRYYSELEPLRKKLWTMPDASKWALFRICRPELFENVVVEST